jgi:hypothetical protein
MPSPIPIVDAILRGQEHPGPPTFTLHPHLHMPQSIPHADAGAGRWRPPSPRIAHGARGGGFRRASRTFFSSNVLCRTHGLHITKGKTACIYWGAVDLRWARENNAVQAGRLFLCTKRVVNVERKHGPHSQMGHGAREQTPQTNPADQHGNELLNVDVCTGVDGYNVGL